MSLGENDQNIVTLRIITCPQFIGGDLDPIVCIPIFYLGLGIYTGKFLYR